MSKGVKYLFLRFFIDLPFLNLLLFYFDAIFIGKNGEHKPHEYIEISNQIKIHIPDKDEFLIYLKPFYSFRVLQVY
jgi:hypothetical protein